jgi:hypothetical protein
MTREELEELVALSIIYGLNRYMKIPYQYINKDKVYAFVHTKSDQDLLHVLIMLGNE